MSVKEILPEYELDVFVCDENNPSDMWFSHRSKEVNIKKDDNEFCTPLDCNITHWQHIEELTKNECY